MTTVHAWFSADEALFHGSSIFRKPSGAVVNVTRTNVLKEEKGSYRSDEKYVGAVLSIEDGGCVQATMRVRGITE